jgi:hypothetical protein
MTLTASQLKDHISHALGGSVSSQLSSIGIINEAGRHMFNTPWNFRQRPPLDVTFVSSQAYADLPNDFGEMVSANMKDGLVQTFTFTTFDDLLHRRRTNTGATSHYWIAISYPTSEDTTAEMPPPRLELYPTPSSSDEITIAYRARWRELVSDDDVAAIPDFADSTLVALVRAFALGYEEEGLEIRVAEVEMGPLWQRSLEKDGIIQPDYGPLRNGALSMIEPRHNLPWDTTANPT